MATILDQIVEHKRQEVAHARRLNPLVQLVEQARSQPPAIDFVAALRDPPHVSLIAEVKKASPSRGILREDFDPLAIARGYVRGGADAISVLTDEHFFHGRLEYLAAIRAAIDKPLLRKDFIVDPYQVYEARKAGADAVLLIAECLDGNQLHDLHDEIVAAGMAPLVELHDPENLSRVLDTRATLIGINNRDLHSFKTDLTHCIRLREQIPADRIVVGESGIHSPDDVQRLADAGIDAMLVGESLMRSPDVESAVRQLWGTERR